MERTSALLPIAAAPPFSSTSPRSTLLTPSTPVRVSSLATRSTRRVLASNAAVLSPSDAALAAALAADPRTRHLVACWPRAGVRDAQKRALMARVRAAVGAAVGPAGSSGGGSSSTSSNTALEAARLAVLAPPVPEVRDTLAAPPPGSGAAPRPDPYAWLRDDARKDARVLEHLAAENAYTEAVMADAAGVVEALVSEMREAIKEADESAPLRKNGFFYYWRTEEGQQYRVSCRRRVAADAPPPTELDVPGPGAGREEVVLDENAEAEGHDFYMTSGATVSPDGTQLAWGVDTVGGESYTLRVRNLATGEDVLARPIKKVREIFCLGVAQEKQPSARNHEEVF